MGGSSSVPLAGREEYLKKTPFFLLASKLENSSLLSELAECAKTKTFAKGANLDKVQKGTFIVVCEGELVHAFMNASHTAEDSVVARRHPGAFFRLAESDFLSKAQKMMGSVQIRATKKTLLLLLPPTALNAVLKKAEKTHRQSQARVHTGACIRGRSANGALGVAQRNGWWSRANAGSIGSARGEPPSALPPT